MKSTYGILYLIPNTLGETAAIDAALPARALAIAQHLHFYIAENAKSARQFLKKINTPHRLQDIQIEELNVNTKDLQPLLQPLLTGHDVGLVSDAGCPAVADPGALLVQLAHQSTIRVIPLVGPSSILLALMASGLNGQQFAFQGYLPIETNQRIKKIKALELYSAHHQQTQIFIETPYRNQKLFETFLQHAHPQSLLCLATDISLPGETILTQSIAQWQNQTWHFHKRPTIFLLLGKQAN